MSAFAWPIAALLFGGLFLWLFRAPITALIGRVIGISKDGITTTTPEQARTDVEERKAQVESLMEVGSFPSLIGQEQIIRNDLAAKKLDVAGDTVKVLIRHLAMNQMMLHFERTYAALWGSQIRLLKRLQTQGPITTAQADQYFAVVKQQFGAIPAAMTWTTTDYLTYPTNQHLLTLNNGNYSITDVGIDFLVWMVRFGKDEGKEF